MKTILLIVFVWMSTNVLSQTDCLIGNLPNSNKISYDETQIEKILSPGSYKAIFYGECHTRDFEPEFKFHFIKHLNSRFGIRHIFMEIGYSAAYFYNAYLETGDTSILTGYKLPYSQNNYRDFWYRLYRLNKTLPDSSKLIIHGVDFERTEILKLLEKLKKKDAIIPAHLQETFAAINRLNKDSSLFTFDKNFEPELGRIRRSLLSDKNALKTIYETDLEIVLTVLNNNTPLTSRVISRNKAWEKHINNAISKEGIDRFVGFFGKSHVSYDQYSSPAVTVQQNPLFKNHVLNITSMYHHFISAGYMGDTPKIFDYAYDDEKNIYEKYVNRNCRATIISTAGITENKLYKKADFLLLAKDIVVDKPN